MVASGCSVARPTHTLYAALSDELVGQPTLARALLRQWGLPTSAPRRRTRCVDETLAGSSASMQRRSACRLGGTPPPSAAHGLQETVEVALQVDRGADPPAEILELGHRPDCVELA